MGGWPAEITPWVTGQVTVAIDPLIGCLTVSTQLVKPLICSVSYCVCLCVSEWVLSVPCVPPELISVQLPQGADKNTLLLH